MSIPKQFAEADGPIRVGLLAILGVLLLGLAVPIPIRALLEATVMGAGLLAAAYGAYTERWMRVPRLALLAMFLLYVALLAHSNLPALKTGLEGIRYTLVALSGLILGLSLADPRKTDGHRSLPMIPAITLLLLASASISLVIHIFFPSVEASFERSADMATAMLGGQIRMQGLLSGPFHISLLGAFLTLAGFWQLLRNESIGFALLIVGETALLLARVRSGLIATIFGVIALALLAIYQRREDPALNRFTRTGMASRIALVLMATVVVALPSVIAPEQGLERASRHANGDAGGGGGGGGNSALAELRDISGDHRAASRADAIKAALDLSLESPIVGWGPGSSASGLKWDFVDNGKRQQTPHNAALGMAIEAGIGALILFCLIAIPILLRVLADIRFRRQVEAAGIVVAALVPLAIFWLLGDVFATLPISLCLLLMVGVFVANSQPGLDTDGIAGD